MIKLGTQVKDSSTNQVGMLTLMQIEQNDNRYYFFQPKAISPKDGLPVLGRWITDSSIERGVIIDEPNIPEGLLGSFATDTASGLSGNITSIRLHINGCFHASIQSNTILKETGTVPDSFDVDIRRLVGDKVPILTGEALEKDRKENPSPERVKAYSPKI